MKKLTVGVACAALMITGCATRAADISAQYVSPAHYSGLNCDQVREELVRVSTRVREVSGQQDRKANNDAVATGVGLIVFWPALFFLMSDDHAAELGRLKGEYEALDRTARDKHCAVAAELSAARGSFQ